MSFGTDPQSICCILNILFKKNMDGSCVPPFQLDYICNTTHSLHKYLVKLCSNVHYMRWGKPRFITTRMGGLHEV